MKSERNRAVVIGVLFLLAMAAYMPGSELVIAALDSANGFSQIQTGSLRLGIVLEFVNSAVVIGIAALLLPILRRRSEWAAVAYAAARTVEAVLLLICSACALLIPILSAETVQTIGPVLLQSREVLFQLAMISLGAGSIVFCVVLLAGRLVPRVLSILGLVGYAALCLSGWMSLFGLSSLSTVLFVPGALFEIAFPIWLFVKGFADPATAGATSQKGGA